MPIIIYFTAINGAFQDFQHFCIKGFKSIKSIENLEVRSINILIGANGVGKSNFIDVFDLIDLIREGSISSYSQQEGGADNILCFGSKITDKMSIELSFFDDVYGYFICLAPNKQDILYIEEEKCWRWEYCWDGQQNRPIKNYYEPQSSEQYESYSFRQIFYEISNWRKYHFHDTGDQSPIKKNVNVNDNRFFRQDGSNLPAYLLLLKKKLSSKLFINLQYNKTSNAFFERFSIRNINVAQGQITFRVGS